MYTTHTIPPAVRTAGSVHGHARFPFRRSAWADFGMYQQWDEAGGHAFMLANREEQQRTGRAMPQVNEEYGYEEHYPVGWGGNRRPPARSTDNRRRLAWEMTMAGTYQTTGERAGTGTGAARAPRHVRDQLRLVARRAA